MQVYAPTSDGLDEEIKEFYNKNALRITKTSEITIVMGDFKA